MTLFSPTKFLIASITPHSACFFAIGFPKNLHQNSNKFADGIPGNLHLEKTKKGMIVKLNAGWDDVCSWAALYDISKKDANMNVIKGDDIIALDTTSSYIRGGKRTIATIGLDNIVIVDSDDALLVAAKGKIQDVKKVAEIIKNRSK